MNFSPTEFLKNLFPDSRIQQIPTEAKGVVLTRRDGSQTYLKPLDFLPYNGDFNSEKDLIQCKVKFYPFGRKT